MKIVVLDGYPSNPGDLSWAPLAQFGALEVYERGTAAESHARMRDADIILNNKVSVDGALMDRCPSLKLIALLSTGYNIIDIAAAKARGIVVCNVPAYSTDSVAQLTMALLLEICVQAGTYNRSIQNGDWQRAPDYTYYLTPLTELAGKTMGIIGFGSIGRRVAELAAAFGMDVLYFNRTRYPQYETEKIKYAPFGELLRQSDVVSLHCPLTPETQGLIDAAAVAGMKDGAVLLNTSRGPVLDEQAVADALHSGKLYAFGADVLSSEPPRPDNPILGAPRTVLTPHIAWATKEARARLIQITVDNVRCFVAGKPQNVVHP